MVSNQESIEISATSVEDAIQLALEQLGRTRDEVEIEILRRPNEPDEYGYASDEALVMVTALTAHSGPTIQGRETRPGRRHHLSPGERMRAEQAAQEILSDLLHHIQLIASCRVNPSTSATPSEDEPVVIEVDGEDLGVLIGRRGENLDSVQYLLNLMVQKRLDLWPNIQVDVAGYRRRREETLETLARRMARRVMQTQQPYTFEPMSPRERRIIHMAIQDYDRVFTESAGEGEDRRVVIYPV